MSKTETAEQETHAETAIVEVVQTDLSKDYVATTNGDVIFAENTPYEVWESYTVGMLEFTRRSMRVVGQCLLFGEQAYGEKYAQVIDAMRYCPKTLANAVWVVKAIKSWHDKLSFAHHEVVAALPAKAQDEMLEVAETEVLPVAKFKKLVKEKYPGKPSKKPKKPAKVNLQDEAEVLQAVNLVIAFLEQEEGKLPFRQWPAKRLANWAAPLSALTKIARRSVIKTH